MKSYVLAFATQIPNSGTQDIVLVERIKDDWQKGRLNLPGGGIEPGETPEQAAVRELREETGIEASLADTKVLGTMQGGQAWHVTICICPYRPFTVIKQPPGEAPIHLIPWRQVKDNPLLIPNLALIIPLCQARVSGWKLIATDDEWNWSVQL